MPVILDFSASLNVQLHSVGCDIERVCYALFITHTVTSQFIRSVSEWKLEVERNRKVCRQNVHSREMRWRSVISSIMAHISQHSIRSSRC